MVLHVDRLGETSNRLSYNPPDVSSFRLPASLLLMITVPQRTIQVCFGDPVDKIGSIIGKSLLTVWREWSRRFIHTPKRDI